MSRATTLVGGYARAREAFDASLPELLSALRQVDLLIVTADHGNDRTFKGRITRENTFLF